MSEPLRYGIIGVGMMGLEHQRNLNALSDAVVVAVADPFEKSLEWARLVAAPSALTTFFDYREMLAADLCDVYVIATPNHTHRAVLDDVMATGRHLLVEKPLCSNVSDARAIVQAARNYPAVFWVGLEYRYMPPVAHAIELARSGQLGVVHLIGIREHRHPFLKKVGDWNRFNVNTGGTLIEKCCHFFDLMRLIANGEPVAVSAFGGQAVNHLDERYDGRTPDIVDHALVVVEFANSVRASLDLCMFAEGTTNNEEISIVGEVAKVEAFLPSAVVRVGQRSGWGPAVREEIVHDDRILVEGFHHGASFLEHLDLIAAIRSGSAAKVGAIDGYWSVVMGAAAHRALSERRVVLIEEMV